MNDPQLDKPEGAGETPDLTFRMADDSAPPGEQSIEAQATALTHRPQRADRTVHRPVRRHRRRPVPALTGRAAHRGLGGIALGRAVAVIP
ncbi:hypothetical protein [Nocardia sp. N2S4-5]|uniref:hypothetical protein n=1 Tax=Nocardia sp. N2S4-5 TaxID=3351565 RepID=UPI0037D6ECD1